MGLHELLDRLELLWALSLQLLGLFNVGPETLRHILYAGLMLGVV